MRKTTIIIVLTTFPFLLSAIKPAFKIIQPHSRSVWQAGMSYTIKWKPFVRGDRLINIHLITPSGKPIFTLAEKIPNKGQYRWRIPLKITPDQYKIRIQSLKGRILGESALFTIGKLKPMIKVINPKTGSGYPSCTPVKISWTTSGLFPITALADINLYSGSSYSTGTKVCVIAKNIPLSSAYFIWVLSDGGCPNITASGDHFVKVKSGKTSGNSGIFQILRGQTAWITVSKPTTGDVFTVGDAMQIDWNHYGIVDYDVVKVEIRIQSMADLSKTCTIGTNVPVNNKTYTWTISHGICPILINGSYRVWIKVSSPSGSCIGDGYSSSFTINLP